MKRIISSVALLVISFSVLFPINFVKAVDIEKNNEIENSKTTSNYSELYEQYLELTQEEKEQVKVLPRKYDIPLEILEKSITNNTILSAGEENIPAKFDLRDVINIRVENQGAENNCWAFASIKSLETYLQLHGYGNYDFSEKHLAYLESDEFAESESTYSLFQGGFFWGFEDYVNNLCGPVLEELVPYNKYYSVNEYDYLCKLKPEVYVSDTINFPTIYKDRVSNDKIKDFRKKVKQHIMENGSIYAYVVAPQYQNNSFYNTQTKSAYISKYDSNLLKGAHAVSIIGWDDNYSKENFKGPNKPVSNGAYIALNSYGTGFGNNGIYYISYEDAFVEIALSGVSEASNNINDVGIDVKFEDVNLYNVFKKIIGKKILSYDDTNLSLKLLKNTIKSIKNIDLSNKEIENLSGIENFLNLYNVNLENNKISNIDKLAVLPNLHDINLQNNKIEKISNFISEDIHDLNLSNNKLTSISELTNLYEVEKIDLSGNILHNRLQDLQYIIGISILCLNDCGLTDDDLKHIKKIKSNFLYGNINLELKNNNFTDVTDLKDVFDLKAIDLSGNKNINIATIPNVDKLTLKNCNLIDVSRLQVSSKLDISENKMLNVNSIPQVSYLYIEDCDITDLSELKLPHKGLYLKNNKISDEDLDRISNSNLQYVDLSNNYVKDVQKLSKMQYLRDLNLSGQKELINLNTLKNVVNLTLQDCNIQSADSLINLNNLQTLDLSNNSIKYYNELLNLNNLTKLNLANNKINKIYYDDEKRKLKINLYNNNIINPCIGLPKYVESIKHQTINVTYENINEIIDLEKDIINMYENRYKEGIQFSFDNCDIENNSLIINDKIATVNIAGGKVDGYSLKLEENKKTKIIKGDVNHDEIIDLYDILRLIELVFNEETSYEWDLQDKIAGEIDGNNTSGNPDIYDIIRLIEYHFDSVQL